MWNTLKKNKKNFLKIFNGFEKEPKVWIFSDHPSYLILFLIITGVFGAGKSFLLSVVILFLVKAFQMNDLASPRDPFPWKLLVSSTTNVAVDRILQGFVLLCAFVFLYRSSNKEKPKTSYVRMLKNLLHLHSSR